MQFRNSISLLVLEWLFLACPAQGADTLRIAAANLHAAPEGSAEALSATHADVIVLLDWHGDYALRKQLRGYRFVVNRPDPSRPGIAILVRTGLRGSGQLLSPADTCGSMMATASLQLGNDQFTVLGVQACRLLPDSLPVIDSTLFRLVPWAEKGKLSSNLGSGQRGEPVVVAGDFPVEARDTLAPVLHRHGLDPSAPNVRNDAVDTFVYVSRCFKPLGTEHIGATLARPVGVLTELLIK